MKRLMLKSAALLGTLVAFSMAAVNWRPLFNGTTYAGWHVAGVQTFWSIDPVDSAFVGYSATVTTPYTMIFSDSLFDQFTIKYSYRLRAGCSGFFFRSVQNTTPELVAGCQVEAKWTGVQSEVGSLYVHPSPGWVVQHSQAYSTRIARTPNTVYQDVVLTVQRPFVYVNVNTYQAVGETNAAELTAGAKAAWRYDAQAGVLVPGRFGLQIHAGQLPMDVRFKNISILEGCPTTDPAFVAGLPLQPAVYVNKCVTGIEKGSGRATETSGYLGSIERMGSEWIVPV